LTGIFVLPKKIVKTIKQKFNGSYGMEMRKVQQKQMWLQGLCVFQKREGGLGIKRPGEDQGNRAAIMRHTEDQESHH
jgi:hypothetical protein